MLRPAKISWKKSLKPFQKFSTIFTVLASIAALGTIIHCYTKDWGDDMTAWVTAAPLMVFAIYFAWNISKIYHKFRKDRSPAIITCLLIITCSLAVLFAVQHSVISKLNKKIATANPKTQVKTLPPLAEKIIPAPENPIQPAIVKEAIIAEVPQLFETNEVKNGDAELAFAKVREARKRSQEETAKNEIAHAADMWKAALPAYNFAIKSLYDTLKKESEIRGDRIVLTSGFLQSVPQTIGFRNGAKNIASIRFETNTNLAFQIKIAEGDVNDRRCLVISCNCGLFQTRPNDENTLYMEVQTPEFSDTHIEPYDKTQSDIDSYIKILVGAQIAYATKK